MRKNWILALNFPFLGLDRLECLSWSTYVISRGRYSSISVLFISVQGLSYYYVFNMVRESIDPCTYSNSQFRPLEVTESTPLDIMYELITCFHEFCIYDFLRNLIFLLFYEVEFSNWDQTMEKNADVTLNKTLCSH